MLWQSDKTGLLFQQTRQMKNADPRHEKSAHSYLTPCLHILFSRHKVAIKKPSRRHKTNWRAINKIGQCIYRARRRAPKQALLSLGSCCCCGRARRPPLIPHPPPQFSVRLRVLQRAHQRTPARSRFSRARRLQPSRTCFDWVLGVCWIFDECLPKMKKLQFPSIWRCCSPLSPSSSSSLYKVRYFQFWRFIYYFCLLQEQLCDLKLDHGYFNGITTRRFTFSINYKSSARLWIGLISPVPEHVF